MQLFLILSNSCYVISFLVTRYYDVIGTTTAVFNFTAISVYGIVMRSVSIVSLRQPTFDHVIYTPVNAF